MLAAAIPRKEKKDMTVTVKTGETSLRVKCPYCGRPLQIHLEGSKTRTFEGCRHFVKLKQAGTEIAVEYSGQVRRPVEGTAAS